MKKLFLQRSHPLSMVAADENGYYAGRTNRLEDCIRFDSASHVYAYFYPKAENGDLRARSICDMIEPEVGEESVNIH